MNRARLEEIRKRIKNSVRITNIKDSPVPLVAYNGDVYSDMVELLEYVDELEKALESQRELDVQIMHSLTKPWGGGPGPLG